MRGVVTAALVLVVLVAAAGCTIGPAANRAGTRTELPPPTDEPPAPTAARTPAPTPVPTPEPAPATGSVTVVAPAVPLPFPLTPSPSGSGAGTACCLAQLPGGDLLVGVGETGAIYRLASDTGEVTHAGALREVTLGADHRLLGLAVHASQPGWLYASYTQTSGLVVARYAYEPGEPPGEQLATYPHAFVRDVPADTTAGRAGGALAFGPDGMLYAGTGDGDRPALAWDRDSPAGKVLRMSPYGEVPEGNPDPGSFVFSRGYVSVTGLAWDATGRLWVADTGPDGAVEVGAVLRPGALPFPLWESTDEEPRPGLGLVYAAGALWLPTGSAAVYRLSLDGITGLAWPPERLPLRVLAETRALFPASGAAPTGGGQGVVWALSEAHALRLRLA